MTTERQPASVRGKCPKCGSVPTHDQHYPSGYGDYPEPVNRYYCAPCDIEWWIEVTTGRTRCGICGGDHDAYSALCPPDEALDIPYESGAPGVIVTAYVTCPECGEGFLAMADEKVTGCAYH